MAVIRQILPAALVNWHLIPVFEYLDQLDYVVRYDLVAWLDENTPTAKLIGVYDTIRWLEYGLEFEAESDAVLFKLTWL